MTHSETPGEGVGDGGTATGTATSAHSPQSRAGHGGHRPGRDVDPAQLSPEDLAAMSRDELVELGGHIDDVHVVHREPRVAPGSIGERRAERQVATCFGLAGVLALAFVVIYLWWPWQVTDTAPGENGLAVWHTPLLGVTLGLALFLVGAGLVLWAKKLIPHEVVVQQRHEGASPDVQRQATGATLMQGVDGLGIARRTVIRRALLGGGALLGVAAIIPLGGLIKDPYRTNELYRTSWTANMRMLRVNGTPIRPGDMLPGSLETVFPAVPGGNHQADAATMLIRLRRDQVEAFDPRAGQEGFRWNDFVAYSKICSHLGCPVSLYEQETGLILCPCHQSQFDITKDAAPVFGPATRSLAGLPITVDDEGYFVARSDYREPVGPAFWDRGRP